MALSLCSPPKVQLPASASASSSYFCRNGNFFSSSSNSVFLIALPSSTRSVFARANNNDNSLNKSTGEGGQSLWRKELQQQQQASQDSAGVSPSWSDESFLNVSLEQDIQGLSQKREAEKQLSRSLTNDAEQREEKGILGSLVEKVLVADFFFILFILAWFAAGLGEKAAFDTSSLIDAWLPLWSTLFQPALGVLMAGAIWAALSNFLSKR